MFANPGFITTIDTVMWARDNMTNITIRDIGEGLHFAQESNPDTFNEVLGSWVASLNEGALTT